LELQKARGMPYDGLGSGRVKISEPVEKMDAK
jgi:hypothetical protein